MFIPNKIIICGKPFTIKLDKTSSGGRGNFDKQVITVGTRIPGDIPENLLHELMEVIMVFNGVHYRRYDSEDNSAVGIMMHHDEFQKVVQDLAAVLIQLPRGLK